MAKSDLDFEYLKSLATYKSSGDIMKLDIQVAHWGYFHVPGWEYSNVNLACWILYWNITPGLELKVKDRVYRLETDRLYLFPPYTRYSGKSYQSFYQFYVHFIAGEPFDRVRNEVLELPLNHIPEHLVSLGTVRNRLSQAVILNQVILEVLQQVPQNFFLLQKKGSMDERIRQVLKVINKNPGSPYSVESLSASVKMSVNNFHRHFLLGTDMTPKQYILRKRLEFSRDLLMNTLLSIDEIAAKSGFSNRYHFSKTFKNYYLFPPVAYRRKMKATLTL